MDKLGIKAGCKHHSFIESEVDEAEPLDSALEWLDSLDFSVRMMDQNLVESHRVEAKF